MTLRTVSKRARLAVLLLACTGLAVPAVPQTPPQGTPLQETPTPGAPDTSQTPPSAQLPSTGPFLIRSIQVQGNQRVEPNTVASYLLFSPGDPYTDERVDLSLKTLYATGLFADVQITPGENDSVLITVVENPIVNRVILEGNKALKTDKITDEIEAEPRAIFSRASVQADVQRIIELYRQSGRFGATVEPKVVQQPQNRVDLIFEITEGPKTGVRRINFIGNTEFTDGTLRDQIATSESKWFNIFNSNDNYDPGRLEFDREQLRSFYTDRGFADFRVVSAVAELTPDQEDFYITFTVDEGDEYRWGDVAVQTDIADLDESLLEGLVDIDPGDLYRATDVEEAIDVLNFSAGTSGYAFVDIQPDLRFNRESKTVDLIFELEQGPRVYIERIDIVGNTTTLDYVIRREMELAEGDAFNRVLLDRSRNRIRALRFFEEVEITETEGSTPDRARVQVAVKEQPTGELAFSAGFSSADNFLVDLSIIQRNLRGRGQLAQFVIRSSSRQRQIDLRFTEPRFLGRNLAAGVELFDVLFDLREANFRQTRRGGQLSLGFPLTEDSRFLLRYALREDDVEVEGINCDAVLANPAIDPFNTNTCLQQGGRFSSILGYSFFWDKRNDPLFPTRGFDVSLTQDVAGLGGDVQYLRSEVNLRAYRGILPEVVGTLSLSGGYIDGWGGESVQLSDRFFKGTNDFRGYDNLGIGPRVIERNNVTGQTRRLRALGGNAWALSAAEISFPLPIPSVSGSLFVEAGTVGLLDDEFQFSVTDGDFTTFTEDSLAIRSVAGLSLFWESPFGPLRFDFTQPLRQFDFDERQSFNFTQRTRF